MKRVMRLTGVTGLILLYSAASHGPAYGQGHSAEVLDVLKQKVGLWDVRYEVLAPDGSVARVTSERHEAGFAINGEIVEIHGFNEGHEDFRGFLLFNPALGKYVYTTIDRTNNHVVMLADRETPDRLTSTPITLPGGASMIFRLVFESVTPDRMDGYGEASMDGGTTWRRVYNQRRTRIR